MRSGQEKNTGMNSVVSILRCVRLMNAEDVIIPCLLRSVHSKSPISFPLLPPFPSPALGSVAAAAAALHMCKSRRSLLAVEPKGSKSRSNSCSATPTRSNLSCTAAASSSSAAARGSQTADTTSASVSPSIWQKLIADSSASSSVSASSLAEFNRVVSNSHRPILFQSHELSVAAASPSATRLSGSSHRCHLPGGRDAVVSQLHFHGDPSSLPLRLSRVSRRHHVSLARLLGASLASPDCILLAYEYVPGATLAHCLRPPRDSAGGFTLLPTWLSRIQVAADVACGLEYVHSHGGGGESIHNRIKSTAIIVTEPGLRAKICHSATAELTGEVERDDEGRGGRRGVRISGTRGYMAPEIVTGGPPSQKADVYAYGVVILELLTGEEPFTYRHGSGGSVEMVSLVEMAREVVGWNGGDGEPARNGVKEDEREHRKQRVRRWVDNRLKDSFPVDVTEKVATLAVACVSPLADGRPEMVAVAGKVSRLLLQSKEWANRHKVSAGITASFTAR